MTPIPRNVGDFIAVTVTCDGVIAGTGEMRSCGRRGTLIGYGGASTYTWGRITRAHALR